MSDDLYALTADYIAAFNACDIDSVSLLLADDFSLTDNVVTDLTPKGKALSFINDLFKQANHTLNFKPRKIYVCDQTTLIEFDLKLNGMNIQGVDIINWRGSKMTKMHAYVNVLAED